MTDITDTHQQPSTDSHQGDRRFDAAMFDAYTPAKMAQRIETIGLSKARMKPVAMLTLAVLAGAFIAFGAMFYTIVMTNSGLGFGIGRLVGGLAFCLGLILVVVGGAELFTGNVLIVMGWAHRKITSGELARNWTLVYAGNLIGALGMAVLAYGSEFMQFDGNGVGATAIRVAAAKVNLPFDVAFIRGVLCNALVCLAIWLSLAARSVPGKIMAIVFPITAFVALGFEHSIANMYFIPAGILAATDPAAVQAAGLSGAALDNLGAGGFVDNLV
ncbi:MAG: formate/nitrite transporter family protein, partial [Alphaproteobacteria bacterium]